MANIDGKSEVKYLSAIMDVELLPEPGKLLEAISKLILHASPALHSTFLTA